MAGLGHGGAWCSPRTLQEGEQGVQPGEVALAMLSPRASSEARGLMQGWGQEPAGTGTEAAAPGILHAKGGFGEKPRADFIPGAGGGKAWEAAAGAGG